MTGLMIPPPRTDEAWTIVDPATGMTWSASRNGVVDSNGVRWIVEAESGWNDPPGVRTVTTDQPRGDGARLGQTWRGARTVVLSGTAWLEACNPAIPLETITEQVKRTWQALLATGGRQGTLTGTSADGLVLQCNEVQLVDQPRASFRRGFRQFAWAITVTSGDPLRYDPTVTPLVCGLPQPSGGVDYPLTYPLDYHTDQTRSQVAVFNGGTADTWPLLAISGPVSTPTVTNPATGDRISVQVTLADGDLLIVDTNPLTRSVLLNGASRRGLTRITGDWLPCPPGQATSLQYRADAPTLSQLTVHAAPAYW